jgi:hypothetical protein
MNKIYYCIFCEKDQTELAFIEDRYTNYDMDDEIISVEYHGICLDCKEQAGKDYWSNFDYHHGLLV